MRIIIAAGIVAVAAGFAVAQVAPTIDGETTGSYNLPDGNVIKLEGVCQFNDSEITCWDHAGVAAPRLAEKISSYYVSNSSTDLNFGFRKKNRWIVVSRTGQISGMSLASPSGTWLNMTQSNSYPDGQSLYWALYKGTQEDKTTRVIAQVSGFPAGSSARAEFADDMRLDFAGESLQFGGAKPEPKGQPAPNPMWGPYGYIPAGGKMWSYFVAVRDPKNLRYNFNYIAYDKSGSKISYVDRTGNPVSDLEYVKSQPNTNGQMYPSGGAGQPTPRYFQAFLAPNQQSGEVWILRSNVNPAKVGSVEVSGNRQFSVLFKDIPLDPK